jgi:hypothetical protein
MAGNSSSAACIFETKAEAPARKTLFRVDASVAAVTTTIFACGTTSLRCRHASSPSCVGPKRSMTMTSGWSLLAASTNVPTSVTVPTTSHEGVSSRSNAFRIPASSSASRTRGRGLLTRLRPRWDQDATSARSDRRIAEHCHRHLTLSRPTRPCDVGFTKADARRDEPIPRQNLSPVTQS